MPAWCRTALAFGPVLLAAGYGAMFTYSAGRMTVRADAARPTAMIIVGLRERYGWKVNYEDSPITYEGDYVDATAPTYHSTGPDDRALFPRGGPLSLSFAVPSEDEPPADAAQVLNELVRAHAAAGFPGRFEVRRAGDEYDVVANAVADRSGRMEPVRPILDTVVTIPRRQWVLVDLISEACRQVSAMRGVRILEGAVPLNALSQGRFEGGFESQPAREVIRSALKPARWAWVWTLNYDVGMKVYALNFEAVRAQR